ncbi:MYB DNA-binding domain-containing protein [Arthroderma uncinatum]|uniref:MYB DNA-binding domain-containing protein n=1 Tax=Arthroderma uncinatum TaxID=74035 RepID=UPI00144A6AB7|nr:MYB DNA-binding domain-containing protein [Arthroderma uncinatum]KAF3482300.1 MYB DNA-binding domain-containing protein [Arthroderma uncinatum]
MDAFIGSLPSFTTTPDDTTSQNREAHQLPHLRIAPLRDPIPPQSRKPPSPLEPNAGAIREPKYASKPAPATASQPTELPTVAGFLNVTAPTDKPTGLAPSAAPIDPVSNPDNLPKTVLPAFINLRAVEKLPYSSFDEEVLPRKRRRVEQYGDTFGDHLQLPIPKNQKELPKQPPPFGPLTILNGLNEPPPNAALFPPIEPNGSPNILACSIQEAPSITKDQSSRKGERPAKKNVGITEPTSADTENVTGISSAGQTQVSAIDGIAQADTQYSVEGIDGEDTQRYNNGAAPKSQPRKKARKWTDEETHDLLRGVVRCGVGNWTSILAQPDLSFNERSAANLKDRFRVCCSWAYEPDGKPRPEGVSTTIAGGVNNPQSGKIFLPDPRKTKGAAESSALPNTTTTLQSIAANIPPVSSTPVPASTLILGTENTSTPEKSLITQKPRRRVSPSAKGAETLSDKTKSTLIALGLPDPDTTVKANRRSRRPFTQAEDEALLKGYAVHGFQWTLIRQDKHLNLMHRKATDLRDRFRTKFPNAYREGGSATAKNIPATLNNGATAAIGADVVAEEKPFPTLATPIVTMGKERRQSLNPISTVEDPQYGKGTLRRPSNSGINMIAAGDQNSKSNPSSLLANDALLLSTAAGAAPIDPAMLPPAPPLSSAFAFTTMDDSAGAVNGETALGRWHDITLPPLVWEELG